MRESRRRHLEALPGSGRKRGSNVAEQTAAGTGADAPVGSQAAPPSFQKPQNKIVIVNMDYTLLVSMVLLVLIGIVMVYSASYYVASTSARFGYDMFTLVRSQIMAALIGFAALIVMSNFNYHKYLRKFTVPAYIGALALLILTVFIGDEAGGAQRWLNLFGFRFQPSEVAKIAVIMTMAHLIAFNKKMADDFRGIAVLGIFIGIMAALIGFGTNNMSSAIIITIIGFGTIFVASKMTWPFVVAGAAAASGLAFILATGVGFRAGRFAAWLDPFADPTDTGFQIIQSLFAIGSGGMFGLGLGQSRQKLGFIPEAHNDIIFSVIAEELGFMGATLVLFLFGVYLWRAIKIALNAKDTYGCLLAVGAALMVGSQAIINIAVVTNSIPNTGVPLPFISHGGTSLLVMMTATGILLNISRYQNRN